MATLLERYDLQYAHTLLRQRTQVAIQTAAYDVINEAADTANHANRMEWANWAINDSLWMMNVEMSLLVQNATIAAAGDNATDDDIQFVVNGLIDPVANLALANKAAAKIIADTANTLGTSPGIFLMQRQALAVIATQTDLIYLQQP